MTQFADATWRDMHASMWMARMEARMLHQEMTGVDLVITSGRRKNSPGGSSLHAHGRAMDLRVWYLDSAQNQHRFADELQRRLGPDFDVIVEGPAARDPRYQARPPHIHVEYDPKGRHMADQDQ